MADEYIGINGVNYYNLGNAFSGGGCPVTGVYYAIPPLGHAPRMGPEQNDWMPVDFGGIDGVWTKDRGFRRREIFVQLVILGSSKADVESKLNTLQTSVIQRARYTITMPGGTQLQGCKVVTGQCTPISEDCWGGVGGNNLLIQVVSLHFVQLSRTNG